MSNTRTYKEYTIYKDTSGLKIEERVKEESSSSSFFIIFIAIIVILFFCNDGDLKSNSPITSSEESIDVTYEAKSENLNDSLFSIVEEVFNEFDTTLSSM